LFSHLDKKSIDSRKSYLQKLNKVIFNASTNPKLAIIILNTSIKNNIVISIVHIYSHNSPVIKTIYYITNVTFTEAELFAIRCGINKAAQLPNIECILVMLQKKSLTHLFILINPKQLLSLKKLGKSLKKIIVVPYNSGTAQVKIIGHFIRL